MRLLLILGERPLSPHAFHSLHNHCEVFALGPETCLAPFDADHARAVPASDVDSMLPYAKQFPVSFGAVGTIAESRVLVTSQLANRLGLPHLPVEAASRSSIDKLAMRKRLAAAGVPVPEFWALKALEREALTTALECLGPMVVKPRVGEFSKAVRKIDDAEAIEVQQLQAEVKLAQQLGYSVQNAGWIAESYVEGAMVSVEGFVFDGRTEVVGVVENEMGPEPYFLMTGNWLPPRFPKTLVESCKSVAIAAVETLGFDNCFFHCELRLSDHGPKIIEVAARLPGGIIPEAYQRAYGINLYDVQRQIWFGTAPLLERQTNIRILQRGRFVFTDAEIVSVSGFDRVCQMPGVWQFCGLARPGDKLRGSFQAPVPIYYYGVEGLWPEDLEELANRVEESIHIEFRSDARRDA